MLAKQVVKVLLGIGEPMIGRMLLYDALEMTFTTIRVRRDTACPVCSISPEQVELIDYEQFCGMPAHDRSTFDVGNGHEQDGAEIEEISVVALKERLDAGEDLLVLDVRNPIEWQISSLNGALRVPKPQIETAMNEVLAGARSREETVLAEIPLDRELVVHCRTGIRSADSIEFLRKLGYRNRMLNLSGGINAWAREVDPSLPTY